MLVFMDVTLKLCCGSKASGGFQLQVFQLADELKIPYFRQYEACGVSSVKLSSSTNP